MKKWFLFAVLIAIASALIFIFMSDKGDEKQDAIPFKTVSSKKGNLIIKVSATGIVEPSFQVEVKSKASGEVLSFPAEEGDRVLKGQPLIRLDKSDEMRSVARAKTDVQIAEAKLQKAITTHLLQKTNYQSKIKSAEAKVQKALANLSDSQDKLKRQEDLFNKQFTSKEALDSAITLTLVNKESLNQVQAELKIAQDGIHDIAVKEHEISLAKADLRRSKIAFDESRERLEETEIFAPIGGILIEKLVEQGQIISSGISNVSGGTALCMIADLSRLFIMADVDETDIGKIFLNQKVIITADAYPDQVFEGTVSRIAPKGIIENSITVFKVKIEVLGQGKTVLKPMMTANVDIIQNELKDIIYISREAVTEKENKFFVAILDDEPKEIEVETGVYNPIYIEIKSGLNEDQQVLTGDWKKLIEEHKNNKNSMSSLRKILFLLRK